MELPGSGVFTTIFSTLLRPCIRWLDKPALPKYAGEFSLRGLHKAVTVRWSPHAIPHVLAADEHDLFFAQGFLHAQERLWQMELNRRFLSGRTAEIFGDFALPWKDLSTQFRHRSSVDLDYFIRLLGIRAAASASLAALSEQDRLCLDAYCHGVNRYIEKCADKPPWEFRVLRISPEIWRPEDSLIIGKGLAFLLSTALYTRLNFIPVAGKLRDRPDKLRTLFPGYPDAAPAITHPIWDQANALWRFASGALAVEGWHPAGAGSNSWTVAPSRTTTGGAILCNDPHLRMSLPSVWYLMHLQAAALADEDGGYDASGASIPGCPLIQLGRNRSIAWGITAALCDDVELYRERLHPLEPELYLVGERWEKLDSRREEIRVRRSPSHEKTIRFTRHGPVISDFSDIAGEKELISLRWTAHDAGQELRALYGLNRARDWREFRSSLSYHSAPTLNFVFADCAGNIGYALAGKVPIRAAAPTLLPLAGWDERNEWHGYIPFDEMPHIYNPPQGFIATANNRIADDSYPYYLSHFFEPPHRVRRIQDRLSQRARFSPGDMANLQLDHVSLHARELLSALKSDLMQVSGTNAVLKSAVERLISWDGSCGASSVTATIFQVFHHRLLWNLLTPTLGEELYLTYVEILNQCIVPTDQILCDPGSIWFAERSRASLVAISLREACAELSEALGADIDGWHWGKIHQLQMNHALGRIPVLKPLLGIGPLATGGNATSINLGFYRHSNPYAQTVGASLRFVTDLADSQSAEMVLASGQSGHPLTIHYADQNKLWLTGDRLPMPSFTGQEELSQHTLLLTPL